MLHGLPESGRTQAVGLLNRKLVKWDAARTTDRLVEERMLVEAHQILLHPLGGLSELHVLEVRLNLHLAVLLELLPKRVETGSIEAILLDFGLGKSLLLRGRPRLLVTFEALTHLYSG